MNLLGNTCACGSTAVAHSVFRTQDHNFGATTANASVMRCPTCGSLFPEVFPSSDTVGQAYAVYYTQPKRRHGLRRLLRAGIDATRSTHLKRSAPPDATSIMDYGCGSGEYLQLLAESGHRARLTGTDISRPQWPSGHPFEWVSLSDFDAPGRQYDWITLSHVIEHLPDPAPVVRRLRASCLASGGVWISTPNADSLLIDVFGAHARDVDFPRHRQIFSRRCLQQMLSDAGFHVEFMTSPRVDAVMNFVSCARNLLRDDAQGAGRKALVLGRGLWRLGVHLMQSSARRAAHAPEIVVIARPSSPVSH